jgi:hypothetical protein
MARRVSRLDGSPFSTRWIVRFVRPATSANVSCVHFFASLSALVISATSAGVGTRCSSISSGVTRQQFDHARTLLAQEAVGIARIAKETELTRQQAEAHMDEGTPDTTLPVSRSRALH